MSGATVVTGIRALTEMAVVMVITLGVRAGQSSRLMSGGGEGWPGSAVPRATKSNVARVLGRTIAQGLLTKWTEWILL